jgi:hypothetical protein
MKCTLTQRKGKENIAIPLIIGCLPPFRRVLIVLVEQVFFFLKLFLIIIFLFSFFFFFFPFSWGGTGDYIV